jgi:hypothetical protein
MRYGTVTPKPLGSRRFSRNLRRRFGMKPTMGPGFPNNNGTFPNAKAAPYFGSMEPFQNASEWWYPVAKGAYQSP